MTEKNKCETTSREILTFVDGLEAIIFLVFLPLQQLQLALLFESGSHQTAIQRDWHPSTDQKPRRGRRGG